MVADGDIGADCLNIDQIQVSRPLSIYTGPGTAHYTALACPSKQTE